MENKRYESRFFYVELFALLGLGLVVSFLDPTDITVNGNKSFSGINLMLMWIGVAMVFAGVITRFVAIVTLKENFSGRLRIREGHILVKNGIYHWIRHPAYLGLILLYLGIPLIVSSMLGFLVILLIVPLLLHRIKLGERMLIERFGAEYEEYRGHTKRLIPFVY